MTDRDQLRQHYRTAIKFIEQERNMRYRVLREPRRTAAIAEADAAKRAIEALGAALGEKLATDPQPEQTSFLGGDRGDY